MENRASNLTRWFDVRMFHLVLQLYSQLDITTFQFSFGATWIV